MTQSPNRKDGRTQGKRLGWASAKMHQRIAAYAAEYNYSINEATIVLLDMALTDWEELISPPPGILENWEVEQE